MVASRDNSLPAWRVFGVSAGTRNKTLPLYAAALIMFQYRGCYYSRKDSGWVWGDGVGGSPGGEVLKVLNQIVSAGRQRRIHGGSGYAVQYVCAAALYQTQYYAADSPAVPLAAIRQRGVVLAVPRRAGRYSWCPATTAHRSIIQSPRAASQR